MSRSGYDDCSDYDGDNWALIRWRGAVSSSIAGKRGQAFLRELLEVLDAMPEKRLIADQLRDPAPPAVCAYQSGQLPAAPVCAIGSVGARRGVNLEALDPEDIEGVAAAFGIAEALVRELAFMNDDYWHHTDHTPEGRWKWVRAWVVRKIRPEPPHDH